MIEGIIFDKDGVLFDAEPHYAKASIEALKTFEIELSEEEYYDLWTKKGKGLKEFLRKREEETRFEEIKKVRAKLFEKTLKKVPMIPGSKEIIEKLHAKYPLALVTSGHKESADVMLDTTKTRNYFKHIIAAEDVTNKKPHPEGFLKAAKQLDIKPEHIIVIEDAEKGINAAHKAKMKSIAIRTPYTQDNDFTHANIIVEDIKEITTEMIEKL